MAGYEVVKVATERARRGRHRRPAREGRRRRRLPDADQPEHARRCSTRTSRRSPRDRARGRRHPLLRRRQPERGHGPSRGPATWASTSSTSTCTSRSRQPHGGGGPGAGPIASRSGSSRSCRGPQVVRARRRTASGPRFDLDYDRPEVDRPPARLPGQLRRLRALLRLHPQPRRRRPAEASETAVLNANYLLARLAEGRAGKYLPVAFDRHCMHEFVLSGSAAEEGARASRRSTSPSGCSTSASTRRRSTSRCSSTRR